MTVSVDPATSGWTVVGPLADLPPGTRREVTLANGRIALVLSTEEGIFACCGDCPHQDSPLIDALLDGAVLTCPLHFWQWDLRSGEPLGIAELPLPVYDVDVTDGTVRIRRRP